MNTDMVPSPSTTWQNSSAGMVIVTERSTEKKPFTDHNIKHNYSNCTNMMAPSYKSARTVDMHTHSDKCITLSAFIILLSVIEQLITTLTSQTGEYFFRFLVFQRFLVVLLNFSLSQLRDRLSRLLVSCWVYVKYLRILTVCKDKLLQYWSRRQALYTVVRKNVTLFHFTIVSINAVQFL